MRYIIGYDLLAVHKCLMGPILLAREQTECRSTLQKKKEKNYRHPDGQQINGACTLCCCICEPMRQIPGRSTTLGSSNRETDPIHFRRISRLKFGRLFSPAGDLGNDSSVTCTCSFMLFDIWTVREFVE
jgi:hypothetical protein